MKVTAQYVVVMAAGLLSLQLAVVAPAQEGASGSVSVAGTSAPPSSRGTAESSQRTDQTGQSTSQIDATTKPDKAGGMGDPFIGGERHPLYRLTKSDVLQANFTFSPDYDQTLTVQPDGYIALKGAGTILAEGRTLPELQDAMTKAYGGFLHEPEISLSLKEFDKPFFLASGEVIRPGKYELRGDITVNEAVAMAGGFTKQARHSQVVLFRRVSTGIAETHVLNLRKMLDSRDAREDMHLRPGDFIFVPESRITKIRRFIPTNSMSWYMNPLQF
ncbi:MAG TPA: polysaccharide biosynthesis/export family protein [Terriglobales bacterium]|nr:polysaccharide biosynthesis/export family protein [Terriglobales bacterium]